MSSSPLVRSLMIVAACIFSVGIAQPVCLAAENTSEDQAAVLAASEKFYDALNAMFKGDAEPFADVWWHSDDTVYMGADGSYNVGWVEIWANWKKQAALKIGGEVKGTDTQVFIRGDMAMTSHYTVGKNKFDGELEPVKLRATSVFLKKDGQWKMIRHHVDVIPVLSQKLGADDA